MKTCAFNYSRSALVDTEDLNLVIPTLGSSEKEMTIKDTWDQNLLIFQEGAISVVNQCPDLCTFDLSYHHALSDDMLTCVLLSL